jgi:hypothetical protein
LELHCRQKGERVHVGTGSGGLVAGQQQESYEQLINKTDGQPMGQLVGDLWSDGGLSLSFSHGGDSGRSYALETPDQGPILLKCVVSEANKFVIANFK